MAFGNLYQVSGPTTSSSQCYKKQVKPQTIQQPKETHMLPSEGVQMPHINPIYVCKGDDQINDFEMINEEEPIVDIGIDIGTGSGAIDMKPQPTRRSERIHALRNLQQEHIALPSAFKVGNSSYNIGDETDDMCDPINFAVKSGKDTLYYHQATRAKDLHQFQEAMQRK